MLYLKKGIPLPAEMLDSLRGREVCTYKNLTTGMWSITAVKGYDNRGKLLAYADDMFMDGARGVVSASGKERIARAGDAGLKAREVVAWFVGTIDLDATAGSGAADGARITFHPYDRSKPLFFRTDSGADVVKADRLHFASDGNLYVIGV